MTESKGNGELAELAAEIDEVGDHASRTVELGRRGFTIAVLMFVLLICLLLPWVGEHAGWQVLAGEGGGIPQLFAATSTAVGILASALALVTRRWWLAWVCAAGGWFASVDGLLAIWSQQSSHASGAAGGGPGYGLIIAWIAMICLAVSWMRTAFSRN
ncbi:hypothetical protein ACIA5G_18540 [Amycolatopsis sp. NPDC051758]|uniref:Rv2732c family membrane protein n=1 Tax=Amycolatopsis sp. NPDC051758 TaxID=3363935 RepID=UPI00378F4F55